MKTAGRAVQPASRGYEDFLRPHAQHICHGGTIARRLPFARSGGAPLADEEDVYISTPRVVDEIITRLAQQVRDVDLGQRIGAFDDDHAARYQARQRLAGAQRRQRAFETTQVDHCLVHYAARAGHGNIYCGFLDGRNSLLTGNLTGKPKKQRVAFKRTALTRAKVIFNADEIIGLFLLVGNSSLLLPQFMPGQRAFDLVGVRRNKRRRNLLVTVAVS